MIHSTNVLRGFQSQKNLLFVTAKDLGTDASYSIVFTMEIGSDILNGTVDIESCVLFSIMFTKYIGSDA